MAGLIACERPRTVAVRVSIPGPDSVETPVTGIGLVALPYDRDSVLAALIAANSAGADVRVAAPSSAAAEGLEAAAAVIFRARGLPAPRPCRRATRFFFRSAVPTIRTSSFGNPAAVRRAAIRSAATVVLPDECVVSVSISSLRISRPVAFH